MPGTAEFLLQYIFTLQKYLADQFLLIGYGSINWASINFLTSAYRLVTFNKKKQETLIEF